MPTTIKCFEHNGNFYQHVMDYNDDSISLVDPENKVLLVYDCSGNVIQPSDTKLGHPNGVMVGRWHIIRKPIVTDLGTIEAYWQFKSILNFFEIPFPRLRMYGESLIDAEIQISKMFLSSPDMFLVKF